MSAEVSPLDSADAPESAPTRARHRGSRERIAARELRSARAGAVAVVAVLSVLLLGYIGLETGTRAVGHDDWLISPEAAWAWFVGLPGSAPVTASVVAVGVLLAALGIWLLVLAFGPGMRRRHLIPAERVVAAVDDDVLAQSLVRPAQLAANVGPAQVRVTVDRDRVDVTLRPTSGVPVDSSTVQSSVREALNAAGYEGSWKVNVTVSPVGVVGQ